MFHDQLFKQLLQSDFASFMRLFFPAVVPQVDFSTLEWMDKEQFTDLPNGAQRTSDLVARLRTQAPQDGSENVSVLFLTELEARQHQTVKGMRLEERLFQYYSLLWHRYRLPIFPVVVYIRRSNQGLAQHVYRQRLFGKPLLSFHYSSVGLPKLKAADYLMDRAPLAAALSASMSPGEWSRPELKALCLDAIAQAEGNDAQKFVALNHVETYLSLNAVESMQFDQLLQESAHMKAQAIHLTWADRMRLEGEKIGVARGEAIGEAKGKESGLLAGKRLTLSRLLTLKFGPLPSEAQARLEAIESQAQLDGLVDLVLTANSLHDLGLD